MLSEEAMAEKALAASISLRKLTEDYSLYIQNYIANKKNQIGTLQMIAREEASDEKRKEIEARVEPLKGHMEDLMTNLPQAMQYQTKAELVVLLYKNVQREDIQVSELTLLRTLSKDSLVDEVIFEAARPSIAKVLMEEKGRSELMQQYYPEVSGPTVTLEIRDATEDIFFTKLGMLDFWTKQKEEGNIF